MILFSDGVSIASSFQEKQATTPLLETSTFSVDGRGTGRIRRPSARSCQVDDKPGRMSPSEKATHSQPHPAEYTLSVKGSYTAERSKTSKYLEGIQDDVQRTRLYELSEKKILVNLLEYDRYTFGHFQVLSPLALYEVDLVCSATTVT